MHARAYQVELAVAIEVILPHELNALFDCSIEAIGTERPLELAIVHEAATVGIKIIECFDDVGRHG